MSVEEAIELGKRAIVHATHRDAYSGGINNGLFFPSALLHPLSPPSPASVSRDRERLGEGVERRHYPYVLRILSAQGKDTEWRRGGNESRLLIV
jgi:hypothetical protein